MNENDQPMVELEIENLLVGHANFVLSVLYFAKHDKLVTSSFSKPKVKIWDSRTYECVRTIEERGNMMMRMIKFDEDRFLGYEGFTGAMLWIDSVEKEDEYREICSFEEGIECVVKIGSERVFLSSDDSFFFVNTKTGDLRQKEFVDLGRGYWLSRAIRSSQYENSVYVPISKNPSKDGSSYILLLNYETNETLKRFSRKKRSEFDVNFGEICVFADSQKNEILVVGSNECSILYFFNTQNGDLIHTVLLRIEGKEVGRSGIISMSSYRNSFLFGGLMSDRPVFVVDTRKFAMGKSPQVLCCQDPKVSKREFESNVHGYTNVDILDNSENAGVSSSPDSSDLRIALCGFNSKTHIIRVKNLPHIRDENEFDDLKERMEYLTEYISNTFLNDDILSSLTVTIVLIDSDKRCNIPKTILI